MIAPAARLPTFDSVAIEAGEVAAQRVTRQLAMEGINARISHRETDTLQSKWLVELPDYGKSGVMTVADPQDTSKLLGPIRERAQGFEAELRQSLRDGVLAKGGTAEIARDAHAFATHERHSGALQKVYAELERIQPLAKNLQDQRDQLARVVHGTSGHSTKPVFALQQEADQRIRAELGRVFRDPAAAQRHYDSLFSQEKAAFAKTLAEEPHKLARVAPLKNGGVTLARIGLGSPPKANAEVAQFLTQYAAASERLQAAVSRAQGVLPERNTGTPDSVAIALDKRIHDLNRLATTHRNELQTVGKPPTQQDLAQKLDRLPSVQRDAVVQAVPRLASLPKASEIATPSKGLGR